MSADKSPNRSTKTLQILLKGLTTFTEEQLKQIPVAGPGLKAVAEMLLMACDGKDSSFEEQILKGLGETQGAGKQLLDLANTIVSTQNLILQLLAENGLETTEEQLSDAAKQAALLAYRERIVREYRCADYRGIVGVAKRPEAASLALDDVYVVPDAQEEIVGVPEPLPEEISRPSLSDAERSAVEFAFALRRGKATEKSSTEKEGDRRESIPILLREHKRCVVRGGPGTGKSTLVRYLARAFALGPEGCKERLGWSEDVLPIIIPLAVLAARGLREGRPVALPSIEEFVVLSAREQGDEALAQALSQEINAGRVVWLMDGVDEAPDLRLRSAVVRVVDSFLEGRSSVRCIVTSRQYGYVRLAGDIAHFDLLHFSPAQIEAFARRWHVALEKKFGGHGAEIEAINMVNDIREHPEVADLASNPLMLVMISLYRKERLTLPRQRVRLYEWATQTLIDTWNYFRSLAGPGPGLQLPLTRMMRVLGDVATATRKQATGVIHRRNLKKLMTEALLGELDEDEASETAEAYIEAAAGRIGLLEERGRDIFAFWHPTFEEFLAAYHIVTRSGWLERMLEIRRDPRWREVLLLAVGHVHLQGRQEDTITAVRSIAYEPDDPLDAILGRNLALAASCISDGVELDRSLTERILLDLLDGSSRRPYGPLSNQLIRVIRALPSFRPSARLADALASLRHDEWEVRMECARLLANVAQSNQRALAACRLLLFDHDVDVRCHAALGLARANVWKPEVVLGLQRFDAQLARIDDTFQRFVRDAADQIAEHLKPYLFGEDSDVRIQAALLLVEIDRVDEKTVQVLCSALNHRVAWQKRTTFERLARSYPSSVVTLRSFLIAEDPEQRLGAALTLIRVQHSDDTAIMVLRSFLDASDGAFRHAAALCLAGLGRVDESVLMALQSLMRNEPGDFLSFEDSDVLEALATKSNVVSEILVSWFHNDDPWLRLAAARTLADSESIDVLFSLLDVENEDVRLQAARFLIDLGKATVKVVASLRSLILSTNLIARRYSACALWARIGPIDDDVVSMIRSWLNEEELDYNAIRLLEGLGKLDVSLVVLLRAWLVGNRRHLRSEAERVLLEIAKANPTVEATFWSWLTADDRSLRLSSARMLCRLTQRDTEVHETLIGILSPDSTAIRLWRKAYSGVRLEEEEVLELEGMLSTFEGDDDVCQATRAFLFETLFVRPTSAIDIPA